MLAGAVGAFACQRFLREQSAIPAYKSLSIDTKFPLRPGAERLGSSFCFTDHAIGPLVRKG